MKEYKYAYDSQSLERRTRGGTDVGWTMGARIYSEVTGSSVP